MKIKDILVPSPVSVRRNDNLDTAASLMWEHDLGVLPIVNESGQVEGVITDRDITMGAYTQGKRLWELSVESSMSRSAITCNQDEDLGHALELMQQNQIRRIPILDSAKKLVGILSFNDVALAYKAKPKKDLKAEVIADTIAAICKHRSHSPESKQVA